MTDSPSAVHEMRLVVAVDDLDAALRFFRDTLGLPERAAYSGEGDARVAILEAGAATLELANRAQVRMIDGVETEGGRSDPLRVAFEVDDAAATTERLVEAGAGLEARPRETPWRSLNARLRAPGDLQITLFQELESLATRRTRAGFGTAGDAAEPDPVPQVLTRERELQDPAVRRDPERLGALLAPDATEIGASGRTWHRDELVDLVAEEADDAEPIEVHDLEGRALTADVVLVTWTSVRGPHRARRSSLWRRDGDRWRLAHHQATPVPHEV
ncbi:DUF4440 domain-containing protein [Microbacterium sediminis]|uniref:VOC domain-containing protein n=1 Tax=Microbacterium sediminis TaxID=904291 RepID=A0A1B9NGK3_9MICO|nr:DUF4440 domain-containing protein [Microbacterium sediminis]OCG75739.1 hypothetical protein A7J15_01435 [Microbacterium sediminis]